MERLKLAKPALEELFAREYPFQSHFFGPDGTRMHYLDEGPGEPLLMVHGNPTWSFYYRGLVQAFRGAYRCIVPDHMGCGLSDVPDDDHYDYTLKQRIDDLEALVAHLGLENELTLLLHDWGGMIGMGFADRHPAMIKRLVIFNTAAFPLPVGKILPWQLGLTRTWLGEFLVLRLNAFSRIAARVCCRRKKLSPNLRQLYCAPYQAPDRRLATLRFVQDIPLRPGDRAYAIVQGVASRLDRFRSVPTLICWGERDFVFDRDFLEQWRRYLPEAEVHQWPNGGHYIVEDALEEIAPLIQAFFDRYPVEVNSHGRVR
ncbi:alpha/beta fold hydrolase [bacterium]|nr:alpha/beta fold hydrolase [bacterium]